MISVFFSYLFCFLYSFNTNGAAIVIPNLAIKNIEISLEEKATIVFNNLNSNSFNPPQYQSFIEAFQGFYVLKNKGFFKKDLLTIIDFNLPSTSKRLWVIDLIENKILFNTYVSHGSGSGENFAHSFSNLGSSNKSSLGFYETAEVYNGKHGLSLKLDGLEKEVNNNARKRGIVVHGASYSGASILNSQNYLGRSQGCPALPLIWCNQIINKIKGKSCIYIYHPKYSNKWIKKSLLVP